MTDESSPSGTSAGLVDAPYWRVEGGESEDAQGLNDTVVRIPPVEADLAPSPTTPGPQYEKTVAAQLAPTAAAATASVVAEAADQPVAKPVRRKGIRRTRKARLRLSRLDPWSVMKTVFLFSIAFGIMFWVAVYLVWTVVENSGIFATINAVVTDLISSPSDTTGWFIEEYVSMNKVLGITALISVINVVLMTALGTIGAFLYNLSANILGGLEVTLAED